MLPNTISHIKNQDIQGVTLLEPWVSPDTNLSFQDGKQSKLEAITDRINVCVDYFYDKTNATHIWIVDGDVETPKHALRYLLTLDADIASGIYAFHNEQFAMMFGKMKSPDDDLVDSKVKTNKFTPRGLIGFSGDGIIGSGYTDYRVGGGNGCMLMKRRVFDRYHPNIKPLRFVNNYKDMGSDLFFWYRAQNAGLTCRIHGRVLCGHLPQWSLESYAESYEKYGPKDGWR